MKNWKYFNLNSIKRESIGKLRADTKEEAYIIASKKKNLDVESFKKIFKVEEL